METKEPVYLTIVESAEKLGVTDPDVVGPFESEEAALEFMRAHPLTEAFPADHPRWPGAVVLHPPDGGYAGFSIVSRERATDPVSYMLDLKETYEDEA